MFTVLSASFLCAYLFIQSPLSSLVCLAISLSSHLCFLTYSTSFFHDVSAFSHSPSFCPRIKDIKDLPPAHFLGDFCVCVMFWFQEEKKIRGMDVFDGLCCCTGSRAGNPHRRTCAPKELPALASPGSPLFCRCERYVALRGYVWWCMCVSTFVIPKSHMRGRRSSEPAPHLAAPASHVSVEQQRPAPGWGRGPGGMLWPHAASGVSDSAEAHVYRVTAGEHVPDPDTTWLPAPRHTG